PAGVAGYARGRESRRGSLRGEGRRHPRHSSQGHPGPRPASASHPRSGRVAVDERGERTRRLAALDHRHVWHPFAPIEAWLDEDPLVIEATEGCELIDTEGNRYLDGVSSLWVNVHGHRNPAIDVAITGHLSRLVDSTFPRLTHPPALS